MLDPDSQGINGAQPVRIRIFLWDCSPGGAARYRSTGVDLVDGHHIGQGETPFIGISLSLSLFYMTRRKGPILSCYYWCCPIGTLKSKVAFYKIWKFWHYVHHHIPRFLGRYIWLTAATAALQMNTTWCFWVPYLSYYCLTLSRSKKEEDLFFFPFNRIRNSEGRAHLVNVKTDLDLSVVSFWMHLFL